MKRSGGIQQPVQGLSQGRRRGSLVGDLSLGIGHRARQHVQLVVQRIEFSPRDDQFVFADL